MFMTVISASVLAKYVDTTVWYESRPPASEAGNLRHKEEIGQSNDVTQMHSGASGPIRLLYRGIHTCTVPLSRKVMRTSKTVMSMM